MANIIQTFPAGSGGGSGTSNYNDLTNKPQIAGIELNGNKSLASFGLTSNVETQSSGGTTKSYVNTGEKYNWNTGNTVYGTCSTSAFTTAKSVTLVRGTLNFTAGAKIAIKFSYTNTASAPTLTINGTVKNIKYIDADGNVSTPLIWWNAGDVVEFTYDGTQWLMQPTMQMLFSGQGTKIPRESIYSTTEKVVGCWTDGRPVYQKTLSIGTLPNNSPKSVSVGITNLRYIVGWEGVYYSSSTKATGYVPYVGAASSSNIGAFFNGTNLTVVTFSDMSRYDNCYITIKYTKTTDSANSFNYADPNDYSTTEKIVGTWVDGKTLYQKTINFGTLPSSSSGYSKSVSLGVSNARVKEMTGYAYNGTLTIPIAFTGSSSGASDLTSVANAMNSQIIVYFDGTDFVIYTGRDRTDYTECYLTAKYTKS